jgi:hypothetical protein
MSIANVSSIVSYLIAIPQIFNQIWIIMGKFRIIFLSNYKNR